MKRSHVRLSVRRPQPRRAAGLLLSAVRAGDIGPCVIKLHVCGMTYQQNSNVGSQLTCLKEKLKCI